MKNLSIVIPIHNEEENLPILVERVGKVLHDMGESNAELILVNDGSADSSLELMKVAARDHSFVEYLSLSRNFGHQQAITAGLDYASGRQIVIMDGDLQDPPELIPELIAKANEGYKVVYAKRRKRKDEWWAKRLSAKMFYRVLHAITSIDIPLDTGDFRLIDRTVLDQLKGMSEYNKFLRGQISWLGFSQSYVLFDRDGRMHGEASYTFKKLAKLALDGITSFSNFPLKLASWMGFVVSGVAFLILLYALIAKLMYMVPINGWTSLMIVVSFLGGIQLLTLGIIGEYISRINEEVRNRPVYVVDEKSLEKGAESNKAQ
jgi:dolichol-phosphate mannosyltransferase